MDKITNNLPYMDIYIGPVYNDHYGLISSKSWGKTTALFMMNTKGTWKITYPNNLRQGFTLF